MSLAYHFPKPAEMALATASAWRQLWPDRNGLIWFTSALEQPGSSRVGLPVENLFSGAELARRARLSARDFEHALHAAARVHEVLPEQMMGWAGTLSLAICRVEQRTLHGWVRV